MFKYGFCVTCLLVLVFGPRQATAQINGFTQPIRQVELASDETGAIAELLLLDPDSGAPAG